MPMYLLIIGAILSFLPVADPQVHAEMVEISKLREHVKMLASTLGERNTRAIKALNESAKYIEKEFNEYGYQVARHEYQVDGETFANIEITKRGGYPLDYQERHDKELTGIE